MADYDIKLNTNQLVDVLSKNDAIKGDDGASWR